MERMEGALSLEKLPLEVLLQILSYLLPRDLLSLHLTSRSLHTPATSNLQWREHFLSLLPIHGALLDILLLPQHAWSFSFVPDGWFRAYSTLHRVAKGEWLSSNEDMIGSTWMVFFKSHLKGQGKGGSVISAGEPWHALVEFYKDRIYRAIDGLPLRSGSWSVDGGSLNVSPYPPNIPSRDPKTWCRVLQTFSVLMVAEAPEFLESLIDLNSEVLREATKAGTISREGEEARKKELEEAKAKVMDGRDEGLAHRLRRLQFFRPEGSGEEDAEELEEEGDAESVEDCGASESEWSEDESETEDYLDHSICQPHLQPTEPADQCGETSSPSSARTDRATEATAESKKILANSYYRCEESEGIVDVRIL